MNQFLHIGSLIFNRALITWIDFAVFTDIVEDGRIIQSNVPAVEIKVANDPETWKLTGQDRDAALIRMSSLRPSDDRTQDDLRLFGTKAIALREIKWVNRNGRTGDGQDCFEIVLTDGMVFQLRDSDAAEAEAYFNQQAAYAGQS